MGPQAHFRTTEMWCGECSSVLTAVRHVGVDADEPPRRDEIVDETVVPVPAPREPAGQLLFRCDDCCLHANTEQVAERLPRVVGTARLLVHLVPAREEARVPVRL